jgi:predicted AAA+ superfamily ATPase
MAQKYVHRNIEDLLRKALSDFPAVIITGARQTGKSTLLKNMLPDYRYITLDDPVQRQLIKGDPGSVINISDRPVIIDEIQYAPEILVYIKMFVDSNRDKKGHFVMTGSQHFNLMANVSESLAGRAAVLTLPTFSVTEYPVENISQPEDCYRLMHKGLYPDPLIHGTDTALFYGSYLQTYLERDIRQISDVSNLNIFQTFVTHLAARSGSVLNLNELARECGIAFNTAKKWLTILQASGIIYLLKPYFRNIKKRMIKSPKVYINDTGLAAYILRYQNPDTLYTGSISGSIFETFLLNEFIKYKYNSNAAFEMHFFRDSNGNEIDLIIEFEDRFFLFEFKASGTVRLEHSKNLIKLQSLFPRSKGYLLGFYEQDFQISEHITASNWTSLFSILNHIIFPQA